MKSGDILTILFSVGDQVSRLRRMIDDVSQHLREDERTKLLAALDSIEARNAQLLAKVKTLDDDTPH